MEYILTARAAELNAAQRMREFGFQDAKVTVEGADSGIDVLSARAVAQVKWKGAVAGRPDLQNLYGARGNRHQLDLFFFTASGYSRQAIDYANEVDMRLFVFDPVGKVEPANSVARLFIESRRSESPAKKTVTVTPRPGSIQAKVAKGDPVGTLIISAFVIGCLVIFFAVGSGIRAFILRDEPKSVQLSSKSSMGSPAIYDDGHGDSATITLSYAQQCPLGYPDSTDRKQDPVVCVIGVNISATKGSVDVNADNFRATTGSGATLRMTYDGMDPDTEELETESLIADSYDYGNEKGNIAFRVPSGDSIRTIALLDDSGASGATWTSP